MNMLSTSDEDLRLAAAALAAGKLVALPTETVYGLGADVWNEEALLRVFEAKRRPSFDPLIVHIASLEGLGAIADLDALPEEAARRALLLGRELWPGPLTLILPKRPRVPGLATSGLPTVAVRCPSHPVARRLVELSTGAVAAPSANPFGYLSPTTAAHVASQLGDRVDYIVDGGPCELGVESTVLDLSSGAPTILRPGGMERRRIEELIGPVEAFNRSVATPKSPGQLPSHYAPRIPLMLYPRGALAELEPRADEGVLFFDGASRDAALCSAESRSERGAFGGTGARARWGRMEVLSEKGDEREAASRLFSVLHELDAAGLASIRAERCGLAGLGAAVDDRLYKASRK